MTNPASCCVCSACRSVRRNNLPVVRGQLSVVTTVDPQTTDHWPLTTDMTTEAQNVKFARQMAKLEASRRTPDKVKMLPRERIRIKRRCKLCGRGRAVYRKFGICRICFRNMASDGLIPGVKKASW